MPACTLGLAGQGQHLDGLACWLGAVVAFLGAAGPLPTPAHTNTDISSLPYKTPCIFYREGMILPVNACMHFCLPAVFVCKYNWPPYWRNPKKPIRGSVIHKERDYRVFNTSQAPLFTSTAIAVEAPTKAPANGMDAIAIAAANAMPLFMSFMVSSLKSFPWPARRGLAGGRHRGLASERCRGLPRGYLPAA